VFPAVPTTEVGTPGVVRGVAEVPAVAAPSPMALIALICMLYEVPLTKAVDPSILNVEITIGDAVVPDARVLNDVPPSVEYL
jgi:hypothetical protein